ncbi:MAG: AAA family ATPase [Anaerolineae bacterium]|nr:AAA family ATPase [Anaerolineae bacterium]
MRPIILGRAEELEALEKALTQTREGHGGCVVVSGEAGVGKSSLLATVRRRAEAAGWQTLEGRCFQQDRSVPYAPLAFMLRRFLSQRSRAEMQAALGEAAGDLRRILPELAPESGPGEAEATLAPEAEKRRFFDALRQWLFRQAGTAPLLLMVEDVHWSDDGSLEFLLFLARRLGGQQMVLLLTYARPLLQPGLTELMTSLDREPGAFEMTLAPLKRADTEELIARLLERAGRVPVFFVDQIYDLTGGNPFFVEEIIASLVASGEIPPAAGQGQRDRSFKLRIPRSIKRLVQQRLQGLSRDARHTADLAAISGRAFDFSILQLLTGFGEQRLLAAVKELVAAQLVVEESAEQFVFRHALTREALYDRLLIRERRALHQELAETIEEQYAGGLDAYLSNLAIHYFEAGIWPKALAYGRQAGERAQALYSPRAAAEHFTRAIAAAEKIGDASLWTLYRLRAQALNVAGDFDKAQADFEAALAAARAEPKQAAEWQLLLDLAQVWVERDDARVGEYAEQALALARELGQEAAIAQSLNWLGHWYLRTGRCENALAYHQQALEILEPLDEPQAVTTTLELLATAHNWCGSHEVAATAYEKAIAVLRRLDDRQKLASSLIFRNVLTLDVGQLREAERIAREIGWRSGEAFALTQLGNTLALKGRFGEALQAMERGLAIAEEIDHLERRNNATLSLGFLYGRLLAPGPAGRYLEKGLALAREMGSAFHSFTGASYLAAVYLLEGRIDDAQALLGSLPQLPEQWGPILLAVRTAEIEVALAKGDVGRAVASGDALRRLAREPETLMGMVGSSYSWFLRRYAEALTLAGRPEDAEVGLRTAQQMMEKEEIVTELWRIKRTQARLYEATRRRQEMTKARAEAGNLVREVAQNIPEDRLRENFLRRALQTLEGRHVQPGRARRGKKVAAEKEILLTPRQREVAAQVALGKSNAEIADALSVTTKTVEAHVSRILARFQFTSRAQIAVWAVEHGLKPPG